MKLDNFYVVGVSHKTLEIEGREEFFKEGLGQIGADLFEEGRLRGYVSLSTCLREELYIHKDSEFDIMSLLDKLRDKNYIYIYKGMDALDHLFRVVCGLESVIKGEDQILAQIKKSYSSSVERKCSSTIINTIFHRAIELGKKFRSKSKIAENALSLEAISVKFIRERVGRLEDKNIFILGVGDLSQGILNIIKKDTIKKITLANRTKERALEVAEKYGCGEVIDYEERYTGIEEADVVVSITSAPHPIIERKELKNRGICGDKKRFFLDLAVPRDIEEDVARDDLAELHNIDSVWEVYKENMKNRERAGSDYLYLIEKQIQVLLKWFKYKEELEKVC